MVRLNVTMFLWFMFLSHVLGAIDEFGEFTKIAEGDILPNEDKLLMNIVPGYASDIAKQTKIKEEIFLPPLDGIDVNNKYIENFNSWIERGVTKRGLTFNIYNDDMREAAMALFRLFELVEGENYKILKDWAEQNINSEMYVYALRLSALYGSNTPENHILPPFILNPHFFVNSETITKAFRILDDMRQNGVIDPDIADVDQYDYVMFPSNKPPRYYISINSNYSGWNRPKNGIEEEINYFREDVALNSYYLGLHMLHPFWMSNEELDQNFPRHAEHYYYAHQQLMARYLLEKEHLPKKQPSGDQDGTDYVPYLSYKNGLPFPTRSCVRENWDNEKLLIRTIDIAIKECISRGLIIMENGTTINMTDDSHIEQLSRLIRANLDGVKTAKVVRSVFGYGSNRFPIDKYSPAPSLLHHPETSLRDPVYWALIKYMLKYFTEYKNTMEPYDLTQYETEDLKISNEDFSELNLTTYFYSYKFTLDYARNTNIRESDDFKTYLGVRQRRLKHEPFEIKLAIEAKAKTLAVVRIFLGPQCSTNCWQEYSNFFELDTYLVLLYEGNNPAVMNSKVSRKHSYDSMFDTVPLNPELATKSNSYSIYKFPDNLLIPRGLEDGLNMTLFVMVTPDDNDDDWIQPTNNFNYRRAVKLFDAKPLGFPFHRPATGFKNSASNYRFYNITIYHKRRSDDVSNTFFSSNLY